MRRRYLAVDVGGTKIEAGVVSDTGRVIRLNSVRSHPHCSLRRLLADIEDVIGPLPLNTDGLAIGFPALGDHSRGVLDAERSLFPRVSGFAFRDHLAGQYGMPVHMTTDANMFALGVHAFGEGRGTANVLALTVGTGLGVGIIKAGRLWPGARGIPDEVLAALSRNDQHLGTAGHHFARLYGSDGVTLSERARSGDAPSIDSLRSVGAALAEAIRRLVLIVPETEVVIVGGGVTRSWRFIAPATRRGLLGNGIRLPIVRTRLNHAALAGGAAMFIDSAMPDSTRAVAEKVLEAL